MLTEDLLRLARRYADDETEPYYVDDDDMFLFLTEAQADLARVGELVRQTVEIPVAMGDEWATLPTKPEIVDIQRAELHDPATGSLYGLKLAGARSNSPAESGYALSRGYRVTPGRPKEAAIGIETGRLKFEHTADRAYTLRLLCTVLPSSSISDSANPTIPQRFHRYLPYGAAVLAMEGAEAEHFSPERVQMIAGKWQEGLERATLDNRRMQRDHGEVHFTNDAWSG